MDGRGNRGALGTLQATPLSPSPFPQTSNTYRLAKRPTLADSDLVTFLDTESGRDVGGEVLVTLLVTRVFGDKVQVFAADDESAVHLCADDGAGEDTAANGDEACKGTFLVCYVWLALC